MEKSNLRILPMIIALILFGGKFLQAQYSNNAVLLNPSETTTSEADYTYLVWSDEFDVDGALDDSKWFHQTKLPNGYSWYNNEIQHYTNREVNSFVDTGYMFIVAKKEEFTDQNVTKQYTSARLNSKFAFTYGKVEFRAKLATGVGTWPALWTLGKNVKENGGYWYTEGFGTTSWPACGEIDIMEHWGTNQNYVSSATHTPSSYGGTINVGGQSIPDASTAFHIYKLVWSPESLVFSVDDKVHFTYSPAVKDDNTWPFDLDQYLLLNVAILPSISANFTESAMVLDYVRVYQSPPVSIQPSNDFKNPVCYPNPCVNEVSIDLGEVPNQDLLVRFYNSHGALIKTNTFPNADQVIKLEDLDKLPTGLYFISYVLNDKNYNLKVAKR
ncbi:MAG: family 16 glycosylhydrolase [Bacteroidales bacterium]|nr:family 16 glycosylhydrolase [Bacteroidales bacterium]MCF8389418.1 family 16 glycosylhydrolase [Bacteroidales bacterium]